MIFKYDLIKIFSLVVTLFSTTLSQQVHTISKADGNQFVCPYTKSNTYCQINIPNNRNASVSTITVI